jgi:hypothetical protein
MKTLNTREVIKLSYSRPHTRIVSQLTQSTTRIKTNVFTIDLVPSFKGKLHQRALC